MSSPFLTMRPLSLALLALPLLAACGGGPERPARTEHAAVTTLRVGMAGSQFAPATATIHAGDTVIFRNDDAIAHTATAADGFDSGTMEPGATFAYRARREGRLTYVCQFHPGMTGALTVR